MIKATREIIKEKMKKKESIILRVGGRGDNDDGGDDDKIMIKGGLMNVYVEEMKERKYVICVEAICKNWTERKKKGMGNAGKMKCNSDYNKRKIINKTAGKIVRACIKKETNKDSSYFYVRLFKRIIILVTVRANRCRRGSFVFDNE